MPPNSSSSTSTSRVLSRPLAASSSINQHSMAASSEAVRLPESKMSVSLVSNGKKRELEREREHGSTTSSSSNSNGSANGSAAATTNGGSGSGSAASKLSKIGKRLRESCRNLRGKQSRATPEDFNILQSGNESNRTKHYVAMDFTGKEGRILSDLNAKGVQGLTTKDGYAYFRRKVCPKEIEPLLTELQSSVHESQPWFHRGVGRDLAQRILATHAVDGAFLVRDSSVAGGFVISYSFNNRTCHAQVLPDTTTNALSEGQSCGGARVFYSLDEGKTKFFDLLQMVEFYQLNRGALSTRLTHYIVRKEVAEAALASAVRGRRGTEAAVEEAEEEEEVEVGQKEEEEAVEADEGKAVIIEQQGLRSNGSSEISMDSQACSSPPSSPSSPTPSEAQTVTPPPPVTTTAPTEQAPLKDFERSKRGDEEEIIEDHDEDDDDKMDTNHNTNGDAIGMRTVVGGAAETVSNGDAAMLSEGD